MSFSATVKDELCRLELGKNCCMLSELAALYRTSGSLTFHGGGRVQVQYRVENTALARRIFRLLTARRLRRACTTSSTRDWADGAPAC